jgi:ABC-type Co2+ transport system permease subunit
MSVSVDPCDKDCDDDVFDDDSSPDEDTTFVLEEADTSETPVALPAAPPVVVHTPATGLADVMLVGVITAVVYGLASTSHRFFFSSTPYTALVIDTSLNVLPSYAMQSVTRLLAGYLVSLVFSLGYAYIAYRIPFAAKTLMLVRRSSFFLGSVYAFISFNAESESP